MTMKSYTFKYEDLGGQMRLSAVDSAGNEIASARYVSSGDRNPAECDAAHKHVHEAANIWVGGSPMYRYTPPVSIRLQR